MPGRTPMTLIGYKRLANTPPPERELLEVADDGRATVWRSNAATIGRFAAEVPDLEALRSDVAAASGADLPGPLELPPGAAFELVETSGRTARFEARTPVAGPWAPVVERCRELLDALLASPVAAIGASLAHDGRVRLEHRGSETLPVELASLQVRFTLWRDGLEAARARVTGSGLGRVEVGPGWSMKLVAADLDLTGGGTLVAEASFVVDDAGIYVPVTLTAHTTA